MPLGSCQQSTVAGELSGLVQNKDTLAGPVCAQGQLGALPQAGRSSPMSTDLFHCCSSFLEWQRKSPERKCGGERWARVELECWHSG